MYTRLRGDGFALSIFGGILISITGIGLGIFGIVMGGGIVFGIGISAFGIVLGGIFIIGAVMKKVEDKKAACHKKPEPSKPNFCGNCGAIRDPKNQFCGNCGARLE